MPKSLKEQNSWKLWIIISINAVVYYTMLVTGALSVETVKNAFLNASAILPAGVAGILVTVLNALPSSNTKARLVYLRWQNPLPGHRAFTKYAPQDHRIDMARLAKVLANKVPTEESEQNSDGIVFIKL